MTTLYELSSAYNALLNTDELTEEELAEALKNIEEIFTTKARSLAKLTLSIQAEAEAVETEIKRLSSRQNALLNKAKGIKSYLLNEMKATEIDKIKDDLFTISLRTSPPSVQVDAEELIPDNFWRIIPEEKAPDKKAILEAHKSGGIVPGVTIVSDKKYLVIK